jgi:hypothetical protein
LGTKSPHDASNITKFVNPRRLKDPAACIETPSGTCWHSGVLSSFTASDSVNSLINPGESSLYIPYTHSEFAANCSTV